MPSDKEMLDWLERQTGRYTGRVVWRWSTSGRGWRLHETMHPDAKPTVREAIEDAMAKEASE